MSFLCTIIDFMQSVCLEETDINNIFKDIDEVSRENMKIENELEDIDREHVRLQIELCNSEFIASQSRRADIENAHKISIKVYEDSMEIQNLIDKIDYTKILQCHHMEMETKCRSEWEPIQECFVKTLKWHDQMGQRYIVQKYNQVEAVFKNIEETNRNQYESMKKSVQQSQDVLNKTVLRRNILIINLIKGSKDIKNLKEKIIKLKQYEVYINGLGREKCNAGKQLGQMPYKNSNLIQTSNNTRISTNSSHSLETFNFMPKLPSFADILNSFNETKTEITLIKNSTNVLVKSILHDSNDYSFKSNQSVTTKQIKHVRFKEQLEEYEQDVSKEIIAEETEPEIEFDLQETSMEAIDVKEEMKYIQKVNNLQKKIEIVDLSTPSKNITETVNDQKETTNTTDINSGNEKEENENIKSTPIEILDCITFKAPHPIQKDATTIDKDNLLNTSASCSYSLYSGGVDAVKSSFNNKSFYEEFINTSSSAEISPKAQNSNKEPVLKDFESYFNENKEFLFSSKESNEVVKLNEAQSAFSQSNDIDGRKNSMVQDFLDFGTEKGFAFDSDDNTTGNYARDLDFM